MKKSAWAALIIMALSLIALPLAGRKVNRGSGEIVVTEEVLTGDPAAAKGITLETATHWDGHLLWNTKYTIGGGEEAKSDFTFSSKEVRWNQVEDKKVYLDIVAGAGYGSAATYTSARINPEDLPFPELTRAVAERTAPGKSHTEAVRIADYVEMYPVSFELEGRSVEYLGDYSENMRYLKTLFHISTGEDRMELTTEKDREGTLISVLSQRVSDGEDEGLTIAAASAFGHAGCYYAYECENRGDGRREERGQNSGIFYQPFGQEEDGYLLVDVMRVRKVCEIPEQTVPEGMLLDEANGRLYLEVRGEEDYRLCVYRLDGEIPVLNQEISIRRNDILINGATAGEKKRWNEETEDYSIRPVLRQLQKEGDNLLITWSDNGFAFVTGEGEENGEYDLWCGGTFPNYAEQDSEIVRETPFPGENGWVFDGDRLVLAAFEAWESVNALVAVYDKEGENYCGLYRHSGGADNAPGDFQNRILPQGQGNWRYFWDRDGELYREGTEIPVRPLKIF